MLQKGGVPLVNGWVGGWMDELQVMSTYNLSRLRTHGLLGDGAGGQATQFVTPRSLY